MHASSFSNGGMGEFLFFPKLEAEIGFYKLFEGKVAILLHIRPLKPQTIIQQDYPGYCWCQFGKEKIDTGLGVTVCAGPPIQQHVIRLSLGLVHRRPDAQGETN